ncbi:MAG: serine hydrolase domain-containing protein [Bacteroidota bacterium]
MKKSYLVLLLALKFFVFQAIAQSGAKVLPESAGMSSDRLARYSDYLQQEVKEEKLAGAVSLIARNGQIVQQASFGYQDLKSSSKMKDNSIFFIQSMTKPIISVGIMMLYEEGHFFLSDPVSQYLPQFANMKVAKDVKEGANGEIEPMEGQISIAQLLSHTAGFSHGLGNNPLESDIRKALYFKQHTTIEDRVNALASMPLIGHPGKQWYYSASPDVLSLLIEHFSGMTTREFLQQRIFDPLGMKDTGYNLNSEQENRRAYVHQVNQDGKLVKARLQSPMTGNTVYGGTHGLFSTAEDYLKFCQMLLNGGKYKGHQLLSRTTIDLMASNHAGDLRPTPGHGFGLGFGVKTDLAESRAAGSVGQYYWSGYNNTYFFIDPSEKLIAILMTQSAPYTNFYSNKLRQFVYQAIVD